MLNYVVLTTAALFICLIQCSFLQREHAKSLSKREHRDRTREDKNDNLSDKRSASTIASDTTNENNKYEKKFYYHKPVLRVIRSDNLSTSYNVPRVEKPNPRLINNKTVWYKNAREQVHVFFADKAREDAYQKTEATEHPYSVVCLVHTKNQGITVCSGTLMSVSLVITAAHCLVDMPTERIQIFGGTTINIFTEAIPNPLPEGCQIRASKRFYPHPKYDPIAPNVDYDIALIKIDPEFKTTEFVRPVEISSTPWNHTGVRRCELTAFGSVRDEPTSTDDFIRKTQILQVEKPCYCDKKLRRSMGIGATSRYICMRPKQDFGICSGDSGGGIVCDGMLTAVVSSSTSLAPFYPCEGKARLVRAADEDYSDPMCGGKDTLSIFQDVHPYLTWIKKSAAYALTDTNGATGRMVNLNSGLKVSFLSISMELLMYALNVQHLGNG